MKPWMAPALVVALALGLEFALPEIIADAAWRQLVMFALVNVSVALSLNVINGLAGQFSIGHAGFVGVGAYTAAIVAGALHDRIGAPEYSFGASWMVMPAAIAAAAVVAGAFGLLVGLPSLRLRGDYLAIVTLGFAEIFRLLIATAQTGGGTSSNVVSAALSSLGGQNGYAGPHDSGVAQYAGPFWVFLVAGLLGVATWRLKFSGWGRALRALREDEIAAASVGVDPTKYKVISFVIAAVGAGMAGAVLACMREGNPTVQPDQFSFVYSFDAITMVIIGGSGSVTGAALGGVIVTFTVKLIEQLQGLESVQALRDVIPNLDLNALRMVVYALLLVALMIWRPSGIFGEKELSLRRKGTGT